MDRVASKVGVATASLYNYFRDKNELLQYTYNRMVEPFFQAVEEVVKANCLPRTSCRGSSRQPWNTPPSTRGS